MKLILSICILVTFISLHSYAQHYHPIVVSGFNQDVIAESNVGNALASTTIELDLINPSNFVLFSKSFASSTGMQDGYGLPDNGVISGRTSTYRLTSYTGKNALFLNRGNEGQLTLLKPEKLTGISILGFATEGPASLDITVYYSDNSSSSFHKTFDDWFDGANPVIGGMGRVKRDVHSAANPIYFEGYPSNPRLYAVTIAPDDKKIVTYIVFRNVSAAGQFRDRNRAAIFAVSGYYKQPPVPVVRQQQVATKRPEQRDSTPPSIPPTVKKEEITKEVIEEPVNKDVTPSPYILQGKVVDVKTKQPVAATMNFTSAGKTKLATTIGGQYRMELNLQEEYIVKVSSPGYIDQFANLNLGTTKPIDNKLDFELQPIEVGTTVNLKNVLFEQATSTLLPGSYTELDHVADFLSSNPSIIIELAGHTDNQGSLKGNQKLSQSRVNEVKKYLVSKGIDSKRITGKGYGSTKPIASNATVETRKLNRRVEFVIVEQ